MAVKNNSNMNPANISRNMDGVGLAVQGQHYSQMVGNMGQSILITNNIDTRNLEKAVHKPSNSLGNAQTINRIMYPITQVPSQVHTNNNNS